VRKRGTMKEGGEKIKGRNQMNAEMITTTKPHIQKSTGEKKENKQIMSKRERKIRGGGRRWCGPSPWAFGFFSQVFKKTLGHMVGKEKSKSH